MPRLVLLLTALALACVKSNPKVPVPQPTALHSIHLPARAATQGKPPLLLLLHGVGTNEQDLLPIAQQLDARFVVRSLRAPVPMGPERYGWFDYSIAPDGTRRFNDEQVEASRLTVLRFIDEAVAADGVDPERVYLAGFSQGGIISLAVALTEPERVAGVVAMSARLLPSVKPSSDVADLPILMVHGTGDAVIPVAEGRAANEKLSALPVSLTYREFPMGHTITPASLDVVSGWLTKQLDAD